MTKAKKRIADLKQARTAILEALRLIDDSLATPAQTPIDAEILREKKKELKKRLRTVNTRLLKSNAARNMPANLGQAVSGTITSVPGGVQGGGSRRKPIPPKKVR